MSQYSLYMDSQTFNYREANPVMSGEVFIKVMLLNLQTIKYTKYHKALGSGYKILVHTRYMISLSIIMVDRT